MSDAIRENVSSVDLVGSELWSFGHIARYRNETTNKNLTICGGTPEYGSPGAKSEDIGRTSPEPDPVVPWSMSTAFRTTPDASRFGRPSVV